MKSICVAILSLMIFSCDSKDEMEEEQFTPQTYNVSGRVEKGPFVSGSAITIQAMSSKMKAVGEMYSSTIQDYAGSFSFGSRLLDTPYAVLTADGYFFDEVNATTLRDL